MFVCSGCDFEAGGFYDLIEPGIVCVLGIEGGYFDGVIIGGHQLFVVFWKGVKDVCGFHNGACCFYAEAVPTFVWSAYNTGVGLREWTARCSGRGVTSMRFRGC